MAIDESKFGFTQWAKIKLINQRRLTNRSLAFLDRSMKNADDVISLMAETKAAYPENGLEILLELLNVENKQARIGNYP